MYLFLERGREGEREGEKHQCVVASHTPPTGPTTQTCVLTGNRTGDPFICSPALNPLSHTSQGNLSILLPIKNYFTCKWIKLSNQKAQSV